MNDRSGKLNKCLGLTHLKLPKANREYFNYLMWIDMLLYKRYLRISVHSDIGKFLD